MPTRKIQLARILHDSAKICFFGAGGLNLPGGLQQKFTVFSPRTRGDPRDSSGRRGGARFSFYCACTLFFLLFLISVL